MNSRMSIKTIEPGVYEVMLAAEKQISRFGIDPKLKELIKIHVSQLNNCGYCLNLHTADAIKIGEAPQRIFTLSAWRETPFFTEPEQAAFTLAEEITLIAKHGVSDETYNNTVKHFGEQKAAQLILLILTINSWNRIAIATHMIAGKD
jgi:AhpD family alkylhydroperoxidase